MNALTMLLAQTTSTDTPAAVDQVSFHWLPGVCSTYAADVDGTFYYILAVCTFFFVGIVGLMVLFCIKYRRKDESDPIGQGATHHTPLEITWSVIPLILALVMFFRGAEGYIAMASPPADSYEVNVTASQWKFVFRYHDGSESLNDLHCWVGQPVKLVLQSTDVLHAFFVPDFRTKVDIVPGRYAVGWFEPTPNAVGRHRLTCAEYCGTDHSGMKGYVIVHRNREEFEAALKTLGVKPDGTSYADYGRGVYEKICKACHTIAEGPPKTGPSWYETSKLLNSGGERQFADGTSVKVDENYIHESVLKPMARIVKGFAPGMTPQRLSKDEMQGVIEYIKSLAPKTDDKKGS